MRLHPVLRKKLISRFRQKGKSLIAIITRGFCSLGNVAIMDRRNLHRRHWQQPISLPLFSRMARLFIRCGMCRHSKTRGRDVKVVSTHGSYQNPIPFPTEQNIEELLASYSIYVVSPVRGYCPEFLLERYNFVQSGVIWKLRGHK